MSDFRGNNQGSRNNRGPQSSFSRNNYGNSSFRNTTQSTNNYSRNRFADDDDNVNQASTAPASEPSKAKGFGRFFHRKDNSQQSAAAANGTNTGNNSTGYNNNADDDWRKYRDDDDGYRGNNRFSNDRFRDNGYQQNQNSGYRGGSSNYGNTGGYAGGGSYAGGGGYTGGGGSYGGGNFNGGGNYGGNYGGGFNGIAPNGPSAAMVNVPWDLYELRRRPRHGALCNLLLGIGSVITFIRNLVFNLIFLLLIFFFFGAYTLVQSIQESGLFFGSDSGISEISASALQAEVLYFDLNGAISEIPFGSSQLSSLQRQLEFSLYGRQSHEIVAIENALKLVADDSSIKKVVISLEGMGPLTLSMAERIGKAMDIAKGKDNAREVVVLGLNISQTAYALAAHADKIIVDSLGGVNMRGIALSSLYFKDLLERFEITPYIFRAGHFKSAVEPFMLNGMSADVRREYQAIAFKSWDIYQRSVIKERMIKTPTLLPAATTYVQWLEQFKGDLPEMQKVQGLVDEVKSADQYLMELSREVNVDAEAPYRPAIITYQDYLLRHHFKTTGNNRVGSLSQIEVPTQTAALQSLESAQLTHAAKTLTSALLTAATVSSDGSDNKGNTFLGSTLVETLTAGTSYLAAVISDATAKATHTANTSTTHFKVAQENPATNQSEPALQQGGDVASARSSSSSTSNSGSTRTTGRLKVLGNKVAVIYGVGEITDISDNVNAFTYDNVAPLIEEAQNDESVGAVVLYLNSPGGSVIASEKIRRALELYQSSGKPLIVSMNGTAASGAYWIASQADTIFATPSTITGSIGVFGIGFGAHRLLNRYGAYQDGVVTNDLALTAIADEMPATQQRMLSLSVENTYRNFIELVARNRGLKVNEYEIFAEGQIFLADDAQSIGLVDELGDLQDAIKYAATAAQIKDGDLHVQHYAPGESNMGTGLEQILFGLSAKFLPDELTYSLMEVREQSKFLKAVAAQGQNPSLMAISPLTEPKM